MKVDVALNAIMSKPLTRDPAPSKGFDHLLQSPAQHTSDDEYYLQHQSQLQPSALRFNARPVEAKIEPVESQCTKVAAIRATRPCETVSATKAFQDEAKQPQQMFLSYIEQTKVIELIQKATQPSIGFLDERPITPQTRQIPTAQTSARPYNIQPEALFKNYQLFIHNDLAEFSFNVIHLSTAQTKALQTIIKKWLTQKGLTIKQVLINGEKQ